MKLSQFRFDLPLNLIAQNPTKRREDSRMMVVHRKTGQIENKNFKDIIDYFDDKDVFVVNNTKVFPARMYGRKEKTGAKIEVFLLRELNKPNKLWDVIVDPATVMSAVPDIPTDVTVPGVKPSAVVIWPLVKTKLPPSVNAPEEVTVPDNVRPLTVPVPETEVTVPRLPPPIGTFTTLVIRPLLSTINCGTVVADPKLPVVALTVANVAGNVPVPVPVTSPVNSIV